MNSAVPITTSRTSAREKLILALDVDSAHDAWELVAELSDLVGGFKVGLQLFTSAGPRFVRELAEKGINIFLDLKFHDIPNTVAKAGIEAAKLGVWMFNVHASGGSEMMTRTFNDVAELCERESLERPQIIAVTVLTSSGQQVMDETGLRCAPHDQVIRLAGLASSSGLDGVVASPLETPAIRESIRSGDFLIVTPGVRPLSATSDDQIRVTTPGTAASNGSDFLVIGRPITGANDRRKAALNIISEMESSLIEL